MSERGSDRERRVDGIDSSSRAERFLITAVIAIASIGLGYLFFTQLWWKVPPDFNCPPDFALTTEGPDGELQQTSGLCNWVGLELVYSDDPRQLFTSNILPDRPGAELGVPIGPLQALNGAFIENVVEPNMRWFGWIIFASEAFIALSLMLGFLSRLGALVAIGISTQLMIGLAGIPDPFEWQWSYQLMVLLAIAMFGIAPGRYFGLDRLLRPRLQILAERGSRLAKLFRLFT